MAIFLNEDSKVIVQGMTGSEGTQAHPADAGVRHRRSSAASTPARPARASTFDGATVPVFGTRGRGDGGDRRRRRRSSSCRRRSPRPPSSRPSTRRSASRVVITEGIPVHDSTCVLARTPRAGATRHHRPELPGPDQPRASPTPASSRRTSPEPGRIGLVSKSGTLTYQMMYELRDIGFSTAVGIGGDPVIGTTHIDCLAGVPGRPGDRGHRDDRRDRRRRRGAGGRLHQGATSPSPSSATSPASPRPRARRWATPARSCPARPGTAAAKQEALEAAGVQVGKTPSRDRPAHARDRRRLTAPDRLASLPGDLPAGRPGSAVLRGGHAVTGRHRAGSRLSATARRVRRPSGPPSCESGAVVSLLARLPRRGRDGGGPQPLSARLAGGAPRSWPSTSPAWPDSGWRSSSSRPSTRPAACPSAGRPRWPASCGSWRRAESSSSAPAPLVLAPLLLTLGIAWGLSRAGRGVVRARGT